MPPVSEKQRRAMRAAAAGNSKLGISASVGREFVKAEGTPSKSKLHHKAAAKGFRQRTKQGYE